MGWESTSMASVTNCTCPFPPQLEIIAPKVDSQEEVPSSDLHYQELHTKTLYIEFL